MTLLIREELVEAAVTAALVAPLFVILWIRTRKEEVQEITQVADTLDVVTENLYAGEKRIGEVAHDALQTIEAVSAQMHMNTKELAAMAVRFEKLKGEMEDYLNEARLVHARIIEDEARLENRVVVLGQEVEEGRGR